MTTGIYLLSLGELRYVGQSVNVEKRWEQHREGLQQNTHHNGHLQDYYNTYNCQPTFKILKTCDRASLDYWEKTLGDQYSNVRQLLPQHVSQPRSPITGIAATIAALIIGWVASPLLFRSPAPVGQGKPVTVLQLANVRVTPNGTKLRTVKEGAVLRVIDRGDGWYNIVGEKAVIAKTMVE